MLNVRRFTAGSLFISGLLLLACVQVANSSSSEPFECLSPYKSTNQIDLFSAIERRYRQFKSVKGSFIQDAYSVGLSKSELSWGKVVFQKPGRMDWSYEAPHLQRFITDGATLWYFQPDDNQVTLADFTNAFQSDLPVSFLLGVGRLSERFSLKSSCKTSVGIALELAPKEADPSMSQFYLLVDAKDFTPIGVKIHDIGGNITSIILEDLSFGEKIALGSFQFKIPLGVDVIDRRRPKKTESSRKGLLKEKDLLP